ESSHQQQAFHIEFHGGSFPWRVIWLEVSLVWAPPKGPGPDSTKVTHLKCGRDGCLLSTFRARVRASTTSNPEGAEGAEEAEGAEIDGCRCARMFASVTARPSRRSRDR